MAAQQNCNQLKSRILENVDLQNGYPPRTFLKIESWKFNIMLLTTSPNKSSKDFSKFCLYVEKIYLEVGPRKSKMAKIGTFAEN